MQLADAGDGGGGIALQQQVDQAQLALGVAGFDRDDALDDGLGRVVLAGHVVHGDHRFQCRDVIGHGQQPAFDHGPCAGVGKGFERQPRAPQVGLLRMGGEQTVEGLARVLVMAELAPRFDDRDQRAAVVRSVGEHRPQMVECAFGPLRAELQLADHAPEGHRHVVAFQQRREHFDGVAGAVLTTHHVGDQAAQGIGFVALEQAAQGLFGKCEMALGEIRERNRMAQLRVVGVAFGGTGEDRQCTVRIAATQRQRAFQRGHVGMVGRDAGGGARQPVGFLQVTAAQRELALHDVGRELVGVQADAARERGLRVVDLARLQQQAGALEVQVGVVGGELQCAIHRCERAFGVAGHAQRRGHQPVRLRIVRLRAGQHAGVGQGLPGVATAQCIEDGVVHGSPCRCAEKEADCTEPRGADFSGRNASGRCCAMASVATPAATAGRMT